MHFDERKVKGATIGRVSLRAFYAFPAIQYRSPAGRYCNREEKEKRMFMLLWTKSSVRFSRYYDYTIHLILVLASACYNVGECGTMAKTRGASSKSKATKAEATKAKKSPAAKAKKPAAAKKNTSTAATTGGKVLSIEACKQ